MGVKLGLSYVEDLRQQSLRKIFLTEEVRGKEGRRRRLRISVRRGQTADSVRIIK
jgi:hypothetical protein